MADTVVIDAAPAADATVNEQSSETVVNDGLTPSTETNEQSTEGAGNTEQQAAAAVTSNEPAEEPDEEEFPQEITDSLTVRSLNEKLAKNPAFAAAVNADPALRNLLYQTARQATKAGEFKSIFATADTAKTALQLAESQMKFNQAAQQGGEALLHHLYDTDKTRYAQMVTAYRDVQYDTIIRSGHPKAAEAVATIAEIMGDRVPAGAAPQGDNGTVTNELPPDVKARLELADRYEQEQASQTEAASRQFNTDVTTETNAIVESDIKKVIGTIKGAGNVALTPYVETMLGERILKEINDLAAKDPAYRQHIQFIYNSASRDADGKAKVVAAARAWAKEKLMSVTRKHLSEFSKPVMQQQTEKQTKVKDQLNQPNVQGAGGASTPTRPGITEQINDFIKVNKRQPTNRELLDFE